MAFDLSSIGFQVVIRLSLSRTQHRLEMLFADVQRSTVSRCAAKPVAGLANTSLTGVSLAMT
jgi:hypothetical protein